MHTNNYFFQRTNALRGRNQARNMNKTSPKNTENAFDYEKFYESEFSLL